MMLIIPLAQYFLFRYAPLSGLQVAFKEFSVFKGIGGSPWADPIFKYFGEVFESPKFWIAVRNTVKLNLLDLLFGFPIPIILAIMVFEMRSMKVKKLYQTLMYLPHFLSWVIIGSLVVKIFGSAGPINNLIVQMGGQPVDFLMMKRGFSVQPITAPPSELMMRYIISFLSPRRRARQCS